MNTLTWSTVSYKKILPRPITTSHGVYKEREGFIICVLDRDGFFGLGDVAPLPGFSRETIDDCRARWKQIRHSVLERVIRDDFENLLVIEWGLHPLTTAYPSLRFGIETALADLAARRAGIPLARWLNPDAESSVEVNGLLHAKSTDELIAQVRELAEAGFRTFKLKVGVASVSEDVERIRAVCDAVPDASLRIDANTAWDVTRFRKLCAQVADFGLEFVEQPLPVGKAVFARQIARELDVALALDEEVATIQDARRLIGERLCDVLVLKPMIAGGLSGCLRLVDLAEQTGVGIVFTSAWESDVGLAATLHLAAACPTVSRASGLATAGVIADGIVKPALKIDHARLEIPARPGLGLELV